MLIEKHDAAARGLCTFVPTDRCQHDIDVDVPIINLMLATCKVNLYAVCYGRLCHVTQPFDICVLPSAFRPSSHGYRIIKSLLVVLFLILIVYIGS